MKKSAATAISSLLRRLTRPLPAAAPRHGLPPLGFVFHPPHARFRPPPSALGFHSPDRHDSPSFLLRSLFLACAAGAGMMEMAHADGGAEAGVAAEPPPRFGGTEGLASQERERLEGMLSSRGMLRGLYPPFTVSVRGGKVAIKFKIPPTCDVSHVIVSLVAQFGLKAEGHSGSEMILRAWDSAAARQLTLNPLENTKETGAEGLVRDTEKREGDICVLIFESLVGSEYCEIEFIKQGNFSSKELDAVVSTLKLAGTRGNGKNEELPKGFKKDNKYSSASVEKSVSALEAMGVRVYGCDETSGDPTDGIISWDNLAGYDHQKRDIEDTILLALRSPEVYDDIARGTRCKFESNRPRAVLFEGPPGTGKTSSARIIAKQAGVPLLYLPLEVIMSKYYGESEMLLGKVFSLANDLPNGAIVFLDEVDSFAVARDSEMHEATRRILSVLLRQIDGFEQEKQVVVIAATNRKQDLDPALISRFDSIICFGLPDQHTREEIAAQYAKHLNKPELVQFALATEEMCGRDIRDVCQQAERHWASKVIRGQAPRNGKNGEGVKLPPVEEYINCAEARRKALLVSSDNSEKIRSIWKTSALA